MVLPWLIVGASAALELRRGLRKGTEEARELAEHVEVERLRTAQISLFQELQVSNCE